MNSGNTIDGMRANDCQICHAYTLFITFLNEGHAHDPVIITRESLTEFFEIDVVDQIDQVHVSREQALNKRDSPSLKSLGKNGVIGVSEGVIDDFPSLLVGLLLFIDQNAQQLNRSDTRVRVIELDLILSSKLAPVITVVLLVSADNVTKGSSYKEILLFKT